MSSEGDRGRLSRQPCSELLGFMPKLGGRGSAGGQVERTPKCIAPGEDIARRFALLMKSRHDRQVKEPR